MSQGAKGAGDEGYIDLFKGLISRVRAEPGYYLAVFVAGAVTGNVLTGDVFGYQSLQECVAKETKGATLRASFYAAQDYCESLFPPRPVKADAGVPLEVATEATEAVASDAP
jgi:hypothetical protein